MRKYLIALAAVLMIFLGSIILYKQFFLRYTDKKDRTGNNAVSTKKKTEEKDTVIQITAVGDILAHQDQLDSQYNPGTKQYDFNNNFKYVIPYIKKADLALANLETTLGGTEHGGYTGYPVFNSPDALAEAVKNAGFGVISAVNNHTIDKGSNGVKRTISVINNMGETLLGLRVSEQDKRYVIKDVKGIKIGMIAYSFETAPSGEYKTLNSIKVPKDVEGLMNTFNPGKSDHDIPEMLEQIKLMKQDGAEFIIFFMHWGEEYHRQPEAYQMEMAQSLADAGVDIIFGSHPHVIEPITYINSYKSGKSCLVVYSMGNFISNQRIERTNNLYTEDGIIVNVTVQKDIKNNKISILNTSYIPTWVDRTASGKYYNYEIIPLPEALQDKTAFNISDSASEKKADISLNNTYSIIHSFDDRITMANK